MKRPKIIMINAVSLDGSFVGFKFDMRLISDLTHDYRTVMVLEGSQSEVEGVTDLYKGNIPAEEESDFIKPDRGPEEPYFVVPDSRGITKGLLHASRRLGFVRDVILLVTEKTSREFIDYLEERHFDYFVCGKDKVDFVKAFDLLSDRYGVDKIRVDAGPTLNRVLLDQGLIDEILLIVYPVLVGGSSDKLLNQLINSAEGINLELIEGREAGMGTMLLHYRVIR